MKNLNQYQDGEIVMKNEVQIKSILAIFDPIDNGLPNLKEYDFDESVEVNSLDQDELKKAASDFVTMIEQRIGGTCAYGIVRIFKDEVLLMDVTITHELLRIEKKE